VISEVHEHLGLAVGSQDGTRSSVGVTSHGSHEVLRSDVSARVVNLEVTSDIRTVSSVEELTWERILSVVSDIVVHHKDDVIVRDTVLLHDLVSVGSISLVSVVVVTVGTGNNDSPVVSGGLSNSSHSGTEKSSSHIVI